MATNEITDKAFSLLGVSWEELSEASERLQTSSMNRKNRKRTVCICGHSAGAHRAFGGAYACQPNARTCHCVLLREVLTTDNLRPFKRVSKGDGAEHALFQGIKSLKDLEGNFQWIPTNFHCDRCNVTDVPLVPALISKEGIRATVTENTSFDLVDIFLCKDSCYPKFEATGNVRFEL